MNRDTTVWSAAIADAAGLRVCFAAFLSGRQKLICGPHMSAA
jgi:hypothetical protein